jgi:hypothetical protein
MKINLHIDRVVLGGLPIERHQGPLVKAAIEAELGRLLAADGLANSLMTGGAMPSTPAPGIQLKSGSSPARIGQQIGRAVYRGIGQ